jgi:hypothetical protein
MGQPLVFGVRDMLENDGLSPVAVLMTLQVYMAGCSDCLLPEDRIRGILALARGPKFAGIEAEDWLHVTTVYTEFSGQLLSAVDSKDRIWWAWLGLAFTLVREADLPSWVPDFHHQDAEHICKPYRMVMWNGNDHGNAPYRASEVRDTSAEGGKQRKQIVLQGKILDEVSEAFDEISSQLSQSSHYSTDLAYKCCVAEWEETVADAVLCRGIVDECPGRKDESNRVVVSRDTYWRTLIGNATEQKDGSVTVDTYQQ